MKTVILQRAWADNRATLGMLKVFGHEHDPFFTLENPERADKTDNRIPAGTYSCSPYSGSKYKDVYEVKGVPGRSAILFHWGNDEADTLGCILIGAACGMIGKDPAVLNSRVGFDKFRALIGREDFTLILHDIVGL